jgi:hypothetical protein
MYSILEGHLKLGEPDLSQFKQQNTSFIVPNWVGLDV